MEDDFVNNSYSQKTSPLLKINMECVVPSSLHIFMGLGQNFFNELIQLLCQISESYKVEIEELLENLGISQKAWYNNFTGNTISKLLRPETLSKIFDLIAESHRTTEINFVLDKLRQSGVLQKFCRATYFTNDEIVDLQNQILSFENLLFSRPFAKVTPKLQMLLRHVVPFVKKHFTWGKCSDALEKVNKSCREVPHDLTEIQAQNRVNVCKKLLENPRDDRFIRRIVTCDEKWVYFSNPDKQNQWLNRGQIAKPVAKRDRFSKKALLCV